MDPMRISGAYFSSAEALPSDLQTAPSGAVLALASENPGLWAQIPSDSALWNRLFQGTPPPGLPREGLRDRLAGQQNTAIFQYVSTHVWGPGRPLGYEPTITAPEDPCASYTHLIRCLAAAYSTLPPGELLSFETPEKLEAEHTIALAEQIKSWIDPSASSLAISGEGISVKDKTVFLRAVSMAVTDYVQKHEGKKVKLTLSGLGLSDADTAPLAKLVGSGSIGELHLPKNELGDAGIKEILSASAEPGSTASEFTFSENKGGVTESTIDFLVGFLKSNDRGIDLAGNALPVEREPELQIRFSTVKL